MLRQAQHDKGSRPVRRRCCEACYEFCWGDAAVGVVDDRGDDFPIGVFEADADPAAMAEVGRPEETLRVRSYESFLRTVWRRTPDRKAAVAVVVVHQHHEWRFVPHEERRRSVAQPFVRLRKCKADFPQTVECFRIRHTAKSLIDSLKEQCRRDSEAGGKRLRLMLAYGALTGENFGDHALRADVGHEVLLFQAVGLEQLAENIGWRRI